MAIAMILCRDKIKAEEESLIMPILAVAYGRWRRVIILLCPFRH